MVSAMVKHLSKPCMSIYIKTYKVLPEQRQNVASSPRQLSSPLPVVELGGPADDKFDACAHE